MEQYITELYDLIKFCAYGDLKEEMLMQRLPGFWYPGSQLIGEAANRPSRRQAEGRSQRAAKSYRASLQLQLLGFKACNLSVWVVPDLINTSREELLETDVMQAATGVTELLVIIVARKVPIVSRSLLAARCPLCMRNWKRPRSNRGSWEEEKSSWCIDIQIKQRTVQVQDGHRCRGNETYQLLGKPTLGRPTKRNFFMVQLTRHYQSWDSSRVAQTR